MKPEKRQLLNDLLSDPCEARREATFAAAGRILRRRRWQRAAVPTGVLVTLLAATEIVVQRSPSSSTGNLTSGSTPAPGPAAVASVEAGRSLNDAELLALFPDTPVGLIKLDNGRKRLVFLRPGDEERFVKHL